MGLVTINSTQLIINYILIFILGIGILFFVLKSFLPAWLEVRRSGGTKILVHVANPLMDYWKAGRIDNGFLYYTARKRRDNPNPGRMLFVGDIKEFSYKSFGVNVVDVDDIKQCVWSRYGTASKSNEGASSNYKAVSTNNSEAYDEAQYTALNKPNKIRALFDPYTWQIVVIFLFIIVFIGIFLVYRQFGISDAHAKLIFDNTEFIKNVLSNSTIVK